MSRRRLLQRNGNQEEAAATRRRFRNPFQHQRQNAAPHVPAIIDATEALNPQDEVPYMTLSNSTLSSAGTEYLTAVSSPKHHRNNKKDDVASPSGFLKKPAKDGMAKAGANVAAGMEQSALNIAVGIVKSSKNFCETANGIASDYLDFFKMAFGAWFLIHVFGSENKLAVFASLSLLALSTCGLSKGALLLVEITMMQPPPPTQLIEHKS